MSPWSIRQRLLTLGLLGVISSGLSIAALARILSVTTQQRVERARDAVEEELLLLSDSANQPGVHELPVPPDLNVVGMHGGYKIEKPVLDRLPAEWKKPLLALAEEARRSGTIVRSFPLEGATLIAGVSPSRNGDSVWAASMLKPPPYLRFWQTCVVVLALATALLVATALGAVVTVDRGASALNASLAALGTDLSAPIARPPIKELNEVAGGIERLAMRLAEARRTEAHLNRELAQQERLAALGRVVAGVAHEVRNPLASIKLRLDLAAAADATGPATRDAIAHASEEITRLDRLVADLLVVAGRDTGPRESIDLGALIRTRADALAPWAGDKHVAIAVDGQASATIDRDSMTRAIDNLLRNAVEASPPESRVEVRLGLNGESAWVRVEDHGPGVAEARATELFEPFFTTKSGGTGLGLALSRSIARAHGGDVRYARRGDVTCFELWVGA